MGKGPNLLTPESSWKSKKSTAPNHASGHPWNRHCRCLRSVFDLLRTWFDPTWLRIVFAYLAIEVVALELSYVGIPIRAVSPLPSAFFDIHDPVAFIDVASRAVLLAADQDPILMVTVFEPGTRILELSREEVPLALLMSLVPLSIILVLFWGVRCLRSVSPLTMLTILFPVAIVDIGNRTRDLSLNATPMPFAAKETPRVSVPILKKELRIAYQASLFTIAPNILAQALAPLARVIGTLNPCG